LSNLPAFVVSISGAANETAEKLTYKNIKPTMTNFNNNYHYRLTICSSHLWRWKWNTWKRR